VLGCGRMCEVEGIFRFNWLGFFSGGHVMFWCQPNGGQNDNDQPPKEGVDKRSETGGL